MSEISVREASASDALCIDAIASKAGLDVLFDRESRRERIRMLVAVQQEDQVVGFLVFQELPDEIEILDLAVRLANRRRGVGHALIERALEEGRSLKKDRAVLEVRAGNSAAQALYLRCGFVREGTRPRYYPGGEDAQIFACCLGSAR